MRFIIRLVGVILFAAAFVVLVIDGTRSIAGNDFYISTLAEAVTLLWPDGMASIESTLGAVWEPYGAWLFARAGFAVLGITGLLLMLIGRAPQRMVRPLPRRF